MAAAATTAAANVVAGKLNEAHLTRTSSRARKFDQMSNILHRAIAHHYPAAVSGKGVYIRDADGRDYIDGSGGAAVSCLGHSHPDVISAMAGTKPGKSKAWARPSSFAICRMLLP